MFKITKPYLGMLIFLGGLNLFPLTPPVAFHLDESKSPFFETFPAEIGEWRGEDAPVDERTYEILETRNVLSRNYKNPDGGVVHLLMVGSFKDRRVAHPPEVCYMSSNFVIVDERQCVVGIFTVVDAMRILHNLCLETSKYMLDAA